MGVNIVKYGNQTLIDLTDTTAVASDVAQGKYFYGKDGVKTEGTNQGGGSISPTARELLDYILEHATYTEPNMQEYIDALYIALGGSLTYYTVTNTLSHITNSNVATQVREELSYTATLTADTDYTIDSVTITMGGVDITSTAYNSGTGAISIASVTGEVVITASASLTEIIPSFLHWVIITSSNGGVPYADVYPQEQILARGAGVALHGTYPLREGSSSSTTYTNYYPFPIPNGATGCKWTSVYLDVSIVEMHYPSNDWIRLTSSGWVNKSSAQQTYSFQNANTTHITVALRAQSTGGQVTQEKCDAISFEWVY